MAEKEKNEDNVLPRTAGSGGIQHFHVMEAVPEGVKVGQEGLSRTERYGWGVAREEYPTNPQERLEWKVDRLDENVDRLDEKIDEQGRRIDRLDEKFDAQGRRIDHLYEKMDEKFDAQGRRIDRLDEKVDRLDEKIGEVKEGLSAVTESIKSLRWLLTVFFLPLIGSLVVAVFVLAFNTLS